MKVDQDVMEVLSMATVTENQLKLDGKLERKLYLKVNKVLEAIGGKWNRALAAHIFSENAADLVDTIILSGEYSNKKQEFGQFDTPMALAREIVSFADIHPGMSVLEPSCGIGNLALACEKVGACVLGIEVDETRAYQAKQRCEFGFGLKLSSFLHAQPSPTFDRVVMNPPFAKQADVEHVLRAIRWLTPDGKITAVMSAGTLFRKDRRAAEFRSVIADRRGVFHPLGAAAFAESGTNVNAVMLTA